MLSDLNEFHLVFKALQFSADKHRHQRRKDSDQSPYINHPIDVAELLWGIGQVREVQIIVAGILHDTLEDTQTTPDEIEIAFGETVLSLVKEVTDDGDLPKEVRKRLQIENAPHKSIGAKQIKLADKISNIRDLAYRPPSHWPLQRRRDYLTWAEQVVAGLRGANLELENHFDQIIEIARIKVNESTTHNESE